MAPESSPHPGQQLLNRKRLGEVVVGAGIEGLDPFFHIIMGRQHQHRRVVFRLPQPAADLHTAEVRQAPVEHQQIPVLAADLSQGLLAAGGFLAAIALDLQFGA